MSANVIGLTGLEFGAEEESGIVIISTNRTAEAQKVEVSDGDGDIVGVAYFGFKATYAITATFLSLTTPTGLASAGPGDTLTLAGQLNLGNVSGGTILCDQSAINRSNTNFVQFDLQATQYPAI